MLTIVIGNLLTSSFCPPNPFPRGRGGSNVLNLVECKNLVQCIATELPKFSNNVDVPAIADSTASTASATLTEVEFGELHRALQKAQLSVNRCLALQLFWSSR